MPRFALKITQEIIDTAAHVTGADPSTFPPELYLVMEMVSPVEFHAKLVTIDQMVEEYKQDPNLEVLA
jgi:hypothetical protein